ncbi:uncharacterized protein NEMAJ01_1545 [Nematocida major]|uniref:uncharacterized protein n=1 Tax=Nematocida major TaxID=1912982 RepID=UPI0020078D71|nr:uncharacterized protein NEMAJ01_1545 [Nematocida major]KAH9386649.1 hypothetical protein NEMAJ01_1545 [Nematocida major]
MKQRPQKEGFFMRRPLLPSELAINANAWKQYRTWLVSEQRVAAVVGRAGIGKETMARMVNKIHNYRETYTDALSTKEEAAEAVERMHQMGKSTVKGAPRIFIFRDIDPFLMRKAVRARAGKVLIISDEMNSLFMGEGVSVIRCYANTERVEACVESACKEAGLEITPEMRAKIHAGSPVRKALSEVGLPSGDFSRRIQTIPEVLDKILHRRGGGFRKFLEIEKMCTQTPGVHYALFKHFLTKCDSVGTAAYLSEMGSKYESGGPDRTSIFAFICHKILYSNEYISFKGGDPEKVESEEAPLTWNTLRTTRREAAHIRGLMGVLARKVRKVSTPWNVDAYTKEAIRRMMGSLENVDFLSSEDACALRGIDISPAERPAGVPRYVYKDGHSHYVTRDVTVEEILRKQ